MSLSLTVVATVKYDKAHQHGVCIYFRGFLRNSNHSLIIMYSAKMSMFTGARL